MSQHHAPKHRAAKPPTPVRAGLRNAALLSGVAVAATGLTVSTGIVSDGSSLLDESATAAASLDTAAAAALTAEELSDREQRASRSSGDRRAPADATKVGLLSNDSGAAVAGREDLSDADPRTIAKALMPQYGLSSSEFDCLDRLYVSESNWKVDADNPSSSAYGIPQSLPGSKMASAGDDWETNPETQIRWGLGYIKDRYGTACSAWSFKQGHNWY